MKPWLLLLSCLPIAFSMCFKEQEAPFRRLPHRPARPVIDFYECKMLCAESSRCLAFAYHQSLSVCATLKGPVTNYSCTAPTMEWLKVTNDAECPIIDPIPVNQMYVRNPKIPASTALENPAVDSAYKDGQKPPCGPGMKVADLYLPDGSYTAGQNDFTTNVYWDKHLGSWAYNYSRPIYVRAAQCFAPSLSDPAVTNTAACGKLGEWPAQAYNTGPPQAGRSPLCGSSPLLLTITDAGSCRQMAPADAIVNCIYGSWFLFSPVNGVTQASFAQYLQGATCWANYEPPTPLC